MNLLNLMAYLSVIAHWELLTRDCTGTALSWFSAGTRDGSGEVQSHTPHGGA